MKLEIGPGKQPIGPDWHTLNVVPPATYVHDIRCIPYPVPSGCCDLVYASHVLEHAPWFESVQILAEWRRMLRPGGTLEVCVPDFAKVVAAYQDRSLPARHHPWWRNNPGRNPMLWINGVIFTYGPDPNWHRACFDEAHLRDCLRRAGFSDIRPLTNPRTNNHGWINLGLAATA